MDGEYVCLTLLHWTIPGTTVHVWDLILFIPAALFVLFLFGTNGKTRDLLNHGESQVLWRYYGYTWMMALSLFTSLLVFMISSSSAAAHALWLVTLTVYMFVEVSVLGLLAFPYARSHMVGGAVLSAVLAVAYGAIPAVMQFVAGWDIIRYDGASFIFWLARDAVFTIGYLLALVVPATGWRHKLPVQARRRLYRYLSFLIIGALVHAVGCVVIYLSFTLGLCLVNVSVYAFYSAFAPLFYWAFLGGFLEATEPGAVYFNLMFVPGSRLPPQFENYKYEQVMVNDGDGDSQ